MKEAKNDWINLEALSSEEKQAFLNDNDGKEYWVIGFSNNQDGYEIAHGVCKKVLSVGGFYFKTAHSSVAAVYALSGEHDHTELPELPAGVTAEYHPVS